MAWDGEERRQEIYCPSHERSLNDMDEVKGKQNKLAGWQKAQAFFITLCFGIVVLFVVKTGDHIASMVDSIAKMDKQIAVMVSVMSKGNKAQASVNLQIDRRLELLEKDVHQLQLVAQRLETEMRR